MQHEIGGRRNKNRRDGIYPKRGSCYTRGVVRWSGHLGFVHSVGGTNELNKDSFVFFLNRLMVFISRISSGRWFHVWVCSESKRWHPEVEGFIAILFSLNRGLEANKIF